MSDCQTPTRRMFTASAGTAFAGMILTACGPKRLYEAPRDKLKQRIAEMETKYRQELGKVHQTMPTGLNQSCAEN